MKSQDINPPSQRYGEAKKIIAKLPDEPGVYFFKRGKYILYVGKATSLRDRVRSYFSSDISTTRGPLISRMLEEFDTIDYQKTNSVLEALILEAHLIKKYQPYYNTKEKSDKSFNFVVITKEDFPRVLLIRGHDLEKNMQGETLHKQGVQGFALRKLDYKVGHIFGPFPNASIIREALVLVRKIFPFRDKCTPCEEQLKKFESRLRQSVSSPRSSATCRPCFSRQVGLCPGVCTGEITEKEYKETITNIVRFFRGEKKLIIKDLEKRMKTLAKVREFEKAGELKRQIFALNHIHDIALIKNDSTKDYKLSTKNFRVEAYDIAHFAGKDVVGVMTVVENSVINKSQYRKFKINPSSRAKFVTGQVGNNDIASLKQVLRRRLNHDEWLLPNLIVVDGGVAQKNAAESILDEFGYKIPIVAVTKNEYHKPKNILGEREYLKYESEILLANSESHRYGIGYHRSKRNSDI